MIAGVILSAGEGKRIGSIPKALLSIEEKTFLEIISENFFLAGIKHIYIVLGYYADLIKSHLPLKKEKILINTIPEMGQLSSLHIAIRNMPAEVTAIMVTLVDLPMVKLTTYSDLIKQWSIKPDMIYIPVCNGRKGHPVIFPVKVFSELLNTPLEKGARAVIHAHQEMVITCENDDPRIFTDIDTEEDYNKIIKNKYY
jgi:CTP:molybdopterin cytidylyltransferase MocA